MQAIASAITEKFKDKGFAIDLGPGINEDEEGSEENPKGSEENPIELDGMEVKASAYGGPQSFPTKGFAKLDPKKDIPNMTTSRQKTKEKGITSFPGAGINESNDAWYNSNFSYS